MKALPARAQGTQSLGWGLRLAALPCLLSIAAVAQAGTGYHKWVDENGNVHFSQKAPTAADKPVGKVVKGSVRYTPKNEKTMEANRKDVEALDKIAAERDEAKQKEQEEAAKLAAKEADCAEMQQQLSILGTGRRLHDEETWRIIPEEERQQRLQRMNKRYSEDCG